MDGGDPSGSVGDFAPHLTFTVIPEPGTWSLLLLGGAGLFAAARRTRRRSA